MKDQDPWVLLVLLLAQFVKHRTAAHKVAPKLCETCRESDTVMDEVRQYIADHR